MRLGARSLRIESPVDWIRHVAHVVSGIKILAIPAPWEDYGLTDHLATWVLGYINRILPRAWRAANKSVFRSGRPAA